MEWKSFSSIWGKNLVIEEIENHSQLKEILKDLDWQSFERIVGKIFEFHNYHVKVSEVVSFENTKRQYDVIAERDHFIVADCKKWDNKRRIKYGLEKAVDKQIERVRRLSIKKEKYPIIVISNNSPVEFYNKVPIISVHELNAFLSNFQKYNQKVLKLSE